MKKSFNVNLGGRIFQIDEDAYEQLNDYLVSVKTCFMNNDCGEEIAADIEARMGELFAERTAADSNIINLRLVNEMIARMGKPESMVDEDGEGDADKSNKSADGTADSQTSQTKNDGNFSGRLSMRKKLFCLLLVLLLAFALLFAFLFGGDGDAAVGGVGHDVADDVGDLLL